MISDYNWQIFLNYIREELTEKGQFGVPVNELADICGFSEGYWEDLEARWRSDPQVDFDYKKGHAMINFWRKEGNSN